MLDYHGARSFISNCIENVEAFFALPIDQIPFSGIIFIFLSE